MCCGTAKALHPEQWSMATRRCKPFCPHCVIGDPIGIRLGFFVQKWSVNSSARWYSNLATEKRAFLHRISSCKPPFRRDVMMFPMCFQLFSQWYSYFKATFHDISQCPILFPCQNGYFDGSPLPPQVFPFPGRWVQGHWQRWWDLPFQHLFRRGLPSSSWAIDGFANGVAMGFGGIAVGVASGNMVIYGRYMGNRLWFMGNTLWEWL